MATGAKLDAAPACTGPGDRRELESSGRDPGGLDRNLDVDGEHRNLVGALGLDPDAVAVDGDSVRVKAERSDKVSVLTVDIEIPIEATRVAA